MSLSLNAGGNERGTMEFSLTELDEAYETLMSEVVRTGVVPHYAELSTLIEISPNEALGRIQKIVELTPGWMHPGTDYIASFPPFNNQPTQYRISVDGEQKWFAQCGFEALSMPLVVPRKNCSNRSSLFIRRRAVNYRDER